MRLEGKAALVTGSSSGIGEAIALRFAREGADVAVHYHREEDEAQRVAAEIQKMGLRSVALGANVGVAAEAEKLVRDAHAALGRLDILVNNAGVEIREPFVEVSEQHYDLVLDVNLKGAFFAAQTAAKLMIDAGSGGRIVNVSSIHEDIAFLEYATYTASKGGMRMLTRTICQELAPARHHRQRHRPRCDRDTHQQADARRRGASPRAPGGHTERPPRRARRGGRSGRLPRLGRGRLRHRQHLLHRRRHGPLEQGTVDQSRPTRQEQRR